MSRAVLFADGPETGWTWFLSGGESGAGISSLASRAAGVVTILVVPGEAVGSRSVVVSARDPNEAREEALFSVGDWVAGDIEDTHAALGPEAADGSRPVCWIDRDRLRALLRALDDAGLAVVAALPDYLALPPIGDDPVMARMGDRVLLGGGGVGAAVAAASGIDPDRLAREMFGSVTRDPFGAEQALPARRRAMAEQLFRVAPAHSLLCGEFRPGGGGLLRLATPVRRFAAGVLIAAAALTMLARAQGAAYEAEAARLAGATESALRSAFPDIGRITAPRAQLRARMGGGVAQGDFLRLTALLRQGLDGVPGIVLISLRFDEGAGSLRAQLRFADHADLAALRQRLQMAGASIEERGSVPTADGARIGEMVLVAS